MYWLLGGHISRRHWRFGVHELPRWRVLCGEFNCMHELRFGFILIRCGCELHSMSSGVLSSKHGKHKLHRMRDGYILVKQR